MFIFQQIICFQDLDFSLCGLPTSHRIWTCQHITATAVFSCLARRKQSLQRVHEEGKRVFDELSEKLYTLEAGMAAKQPRSVSPRGARLPG